jgi:ribosomal 30S subunit maturation factor RimM
MRNVIPDGQDNLLAIGRLGSPFGVQGFLRVQ